MPKTSPTFFQVINTDYLAQNFFVMMFGGWAIYAVDAAFDGHTTFYLAIFAAVCTLLGSPAFFWRYRLIVSTFANGTEIMGRVTEVVSIRKDCIVSYEYDFRGAYFQYRNRVKKNAYTQKLKPNQPVTLLAHEKTPHIAFIKEMYLEYPQ